MLFTSESVTEGHPDKICDQISDAILDELIRKDPNSKVAIESAVKSGLVYVFGEISTNAWCNTEKIARSVIRDIGFVGSELGFDANTCGIITSISEQSSEIAQGVDQAEQGAGDQGLMFGYASDETPELMPLPITLAHQLTQKLTEARKSGVIDFLRPDGKSQVTVEYTRDKEPRRVHTVVLSAQHSLEIDQEELRRIIKSEIIEASIGQYLDDETIFHINPTGSFVQGGPVADAGLTGRKIVVDTYGGYAPHGGGCFSGKDPSKVDRSGAYIARYMAKNMVASGLAQKCQVQISYAIGIAEPVSIYIETFGTGKVGDQKLEEIAYEYFPTKPADIIGYFDLKRPIYRSTSTNGHFGNSDFPWEKIDIAETLKAKFL
jgi:S-adenosylmethionine synthetase